MGQGGEVVLRVSEQKGTDVNAKYGPHRSDAGLLLTERRGEKKNERRSIKR